MEEFSSRALRFQVPRPPEEETSSEVHGSATRTMINSWRQSLRNFARFSTSKRNPTADRPSNHLELTSNQSEIPPSFNVEALGRGTDEDVRNVRNLDNGQILVKIDEHNCRHISHPDLHSKTSGSPALINIVNTAKFAVRFKRGGGIPAAVDHDPNHKPVESAFQRDTTRRTIWPGKDYTNWIVQDTEQDAAFNQDIFDRSQTVRMPWHDIAAVVYGRSARDFGRHFIQRWNAVKIQKAHKKAHYPYLLPKSYKKSLISPNSGSISREEIVSARVQALRSVSKWSASINSVESSIYQAYLWVILQAEHYLYIENQFFITACIDDDIIQNRLGSLILARIVWAHENRRKFKVYLVLPLLPAFAGTIDRAGGFMIKAILHYLYRSLCRGEDSLFSLLRKRGINPDEYVSVCGLRTVGKLQGTMKTELIYVHSKLLIADDRFVILGSANLNDRSLVGYRDSELAMLVNDSHFTATHCAGSSVCTRMGRFAGSLRLALMREHLGVPSNFKIYATSDLRATPSSDGENKLWSPSAVNPEWNYELLSDPSSDEFFNNVWIKTANQNTQCYEEVFGCCPTDSTRDYDELAEFRRQKYLIETDCSAAELRLWKEIRGYLVRFPLNFLCNEILEPRANQREGLLPNHVWF